MQYELELTDETTGARAGIIRTAHGEVETPLFMPVATKATVKTVDKSDLEALGAGALISNAFLLYLRPGLSIINDAGGLHRFMNWDRVLFTDSGGFQMIRREFLKGVDQNGIKFNSPYDGTFHQFTPEKNMEVQIGLGSDIMMVQDDCPKHDAAPAEVGASVERTVAWAGRCKRYFDEHADRSRQALFGIVQGGTDNEMRSRCLEKLVPMDFDGYAVGGLSIGEPKPDMHRTLEDLVPGLPEHKPRYLMGVGSPEDIVRSISVGVDVFDSVFPTRNARHNTVYTSKGKVNISRSSFRNDLGPLDDGCTCFTCTNHSRAYVNHLLREKELLGLRLATLHNLHFLLVLVKNCRKAVKEGEFLRFQREFLENYRV